ncbi:MAG: NAD(P)-dependent oxidoreductase [Alphaproteobacteria bacterium]|nr:NAD(P)-dependent oxidoreductase [Alphaproteobacteria bacterium]
MSEKNAARPRRIVVTGAAGFVGSHACLALTQERNYHVVAACRDGSRLSPQFDGEVVEGDLRDPNHRQTLVEGADTIVHAAAWSSLYGHKSQSNRLFRDPSLALLEDAVAAGIKRFIMISTTAAAPPAAAADANAPGHAPGFWPHLDNIVAIEDAMRTRVRPGCAMVSLRLGLFVGERYALGLLPILVPRLKSHLVPWVAGGRTPMPLIAGEDIGYAISRAVGAEGLSGYEGYNIVGPDIPQARDVINFLAKQYGLPKPWFSVPFPLAHAFAAIMEWVSRLTPWNPFITRSIIHLLRDFHVNNEKAYTVLGYVPRTDWRDAVTRQMAEMAERQPRPMGMVRPLPDDLPH